MSVPRTAARLALGTAGLAWGPALASVGPVRRAVLPRLAGRSDRDHVALTFDDGPDPESTPAFLDLLARHDVRATFFVLGAQVAGNEDLLRRMVAEGHEIGLHGWDHRCTVLVPRLYGLLARARGHVEHASGVPLRWYRPPYGVLTTETLLASRRLGLEPVLWTAWGREWERRATPERIVRSVTTTLRPGGTVLLHDTDRHAPYGCWRRTYAATERLLDGPLSDVAIGPLAEHWTVRSAQLVGQPV